MTRWQARATILVALLTLHATPGQAQVIVHDPTSYGRLIQQAQTALDQLTALKAQVAESQRLYDALNQASGAGALAPALAAPTLRAVVPDADTFLAAARGDLEALGALGRKAQALRDTNRLYTADPARPGDLELEEAGNRAARDVALGQAVASAGAERLAGLQTLASAIDTAPNVRAVADIQARLAAEQTLIANDQMRLQALAMTQAAEERLARQRAKERAKAESEARIKLYEGAFQ